MPDIDNRPPPTEAEHAAALEAEKQYALDQERFRRIVSIATPFISVVIALLVGSVVILASGHSPIEAYAAMFYGAFGGVRQIGETLLRATPLIFTGLAVAYGFRSGLFNIGAEGQLFLGGMAAAFVGVMIAGLPVGRIGAPDPAFRHVGGRRVGVHSGADEGEDRRTRGHHDHDVHLHRSLPRVLDSHRPVQGRGSDSADAAAACHEPAPAHLRRVPVPRPEPGASWVHPRRGGSHHRVVDSQVHGAGLRSQGGRLQPVRVADRWRVGLCDHHQVALHLGIDRGSGGRDRGDGRPLPAVRPVLVRFRVHGYRRRAARQEQPDRRDCRGHPLRRLCRPVPGRCSWRRGSPRRSSRSFRARSSSSSVPRR